VYCSTVCFLLSIVVPGSTLSQVPTAMSADSSLRMFLPQFEEGHTRFINGDPILWKQNASHRDDATIMGAWGGYENGWNEVSSRYDWVAAQLKESGAKAKVEYLSSGMSGSLAYTVTIERSEILRANQEKPTPPALRVTHISGRRTVVGNSCIATLIP